LSAPPSPGRGVVLLRRATEPGPGRRLLLVSYHFPPGTGIGALRWRRMIPLLAEAGWAVDVVTVAPEATPEDGAALAELPPSTEVLGVPDSRPFAARVEHAAWLLYRSARDAAARAAAFRERAVETAAGEAGAGPPRRGRPPAVAAADVRWNLDSPRGWLRVFWARLERRRGRAWARAAADAALALGAGRAYDAVVVSSPPHWTQYAGPRIAEGFAIPYLADLRDPWAATAFLPEHVATPEWLRLARADERKAVRGAARLLANTEAAAEALRAAHPGRADAVRVVRNGWDRATRRREAGSRFVIAYAGSIYGDRSPEPLFRAMARMRADRDLAPEHFGAELMGPIDGGADRVRQLAAAAGVADLVRVHPPGSRADARRFMAGAAVLVSLPWSQHLAVPAKVYDYLGFEAWPVILAGPDSAPAVMLEGTGAAVADPADPDGVAQLLCGLYDRWRAGERPGPVAGREAFHRSEAVKTLVHDLEDVVA